MKNIEALLTDNDIAFTVLHDGGECGCPGCDVAALAA